MDADPLDRALEVADQAVRAGEAWRERALAAERRADQLRESNRALVRLLRDCRTRSTRRRQQRRQEGT